MRNHLGLFLSKRAHLSPRMEAVVEVERGRRFSFVDLEARANRAAQALSARGIGPGDRVALLLMNGVEFLEGFFGIAKLGGVVVPLNWRLVADELEFILKDSGSTCLLYDREFEDVVAELQKRGCGVETWLRVGDAGSTPDWAEDWDGARDGASAEPVACVGDSDDLLFIMYTSGTTGLPKGVVHTHGTMTYASLTINMTADMRYGDRYLQMLPLFHVGALTPVVSSLHRGATLVMLRAFDPSRVFPLIEEEKITTGLAVPAMLQFMLQAPNREQHDHSTLRWLMSGAAPVPVPLIQRYDELGIEIQQVYGLTESGGPACLISSEAAISKAGSTGPAFFHTEVQVVGDDGKPVSPGEMGEVLVSGPHVMKEYWNRPDATAETLKDGWLHTGDMATVDEDGYVYIQDRKKDMIISGGENIYPAEIENVLAGHPDLVEAAVIGQPSDKWGESPAAIVVVKEGAKLSEDEVLEFLKPKLARYKLPRRVEFVDEIPRNPTGKILKRILRDQFPGPAPD